MNNNEEKGIFDEGGFARFYIISWRFVLFVVLILISSIFIIKYPEKYNYDENIENIGYLFLSIFLTLVPFTGFWRIIAWGFVEKGRGHGGNGGIGHLVNEEQKEYLAPKIAMLFEILNFLGAILFFIGMLMVFIL